MIELKAGMTICQLVDKFLDRKIPEYSSGGNITAHGLLFNLDISISNYNEIDFNERQYMWFLLTRNTSVFVAIPNMEDDHWYHWTEIPASAWKNTSNHDSCWRSDGVDSPITSVYFKLTEEINRRRVKAGLEEVAPGSMHQFSHLSSAVFRDMTVTTASDRDTHNPDYFRKIISLEERNNS